MAPRKKHPPTFGERLREARLEAGLSQSYMSRELGITEKAYWDWEMDNSEPRLGNYMRAKAIIEEHSERAAMMLEAVSAADFDPNGWFAHQPLDQALATPAPIPAAV